MNVTTPIEWVMFFSAALTSASSAIYYLSKRDSVTFAALRTILAYATAVFAMFAGYPIVSVPFMMVSLLFLAVVAGFNEKQNP